MPAGGRPTVRSRRLGTALRQYRQAAKLDQPQAAEVIASSQARISRVESGHATPRVIEVRLLLDAYGVTDAEVRGRLEDLAKYSKKRGWWQEYAGRLRPDYLDHIALEDDASHIRQWQPVLVPGLLQTPAYAELVITEGPRELSPEQIAELVKVRSRRQERIAEGGVKYTVVLWEAVITYPLLTAAVHREQLSAFLEVARRTNVTLQILPFSSGTLAAGTSAFAAFSFESESAIEVVTMDDLMCTTILEDPDDLAVHATTFDLLQSAALSPEESAELIQRKLRKIKEDAS
ncbi:helix-turn-helix domain-containing protein [Streptomyces sp. ISL-12]|uniref:helix-turn-helix domain-containing protein n=1 Tax=Streptomyces sp. ISL-12 TaxID=2819177 RepID=UPI001BEC2785|nr:helix-turn-helix transcriptional regulator [Streptomyces sp. ISL-12]MBT2411069.1 helix-turn-helix domain-containing protein [Streptomyces sp. ISL-12]